MALHDILSKEECEKILAKSVGHPTDLLSYKIKRFSDKVMGFLGEHLQLSIKFRSYNKTHRVRFFVKTTPQFNENQRKYVEDSGIFKKEVVLYQNLLGELQKINYFSPRCYFVEHNCIVLEDLSLRGFANLPRLDYLSEKHCFAVLETLGKYHASSLIFQDKTGIKINEKFTDEIQETSFSFTKGEPREKWLVNVTICVKNLMRLINCDDICQKFHDFVWEELPTLIQPSKKFQNVITHDDLWCNNMMFDSQGKCVFVDFQMVRYTPPAFEFLVVLYLNLDASYLEENLENLKKIYFGVLASELKKHNVENVITKEEFEESLEYYKLAALVESTMYGTHVYISEELAERIMDIDNYNEFSFINRSKYLVREFKQDPCFRTRICNLLLPLAKIYKE